MRSPAGTEVLPAAACAWAGHLVALLRLLWLWLAFLCAVSLCAAVAGEPVSICVITKGPHNSLHGALRGQRAANAQVAQWT